MKKVNVLLVVAGLFITGVMVYLMMSGVSLKERRMVKWSLVSGPAKAGDKVAGFMYPIMKESDSLQFIGKGDFYETFVQEFTARARRDQVTTEIVQSQNPAEGTFVVEILEINKPQFIEACKKMERTACVGVKALRKFAKKERASGLWINMYRLTKDKAVLFYIKAQ